MSKRSAGQGGVCGRVLRLLQPFGEIAVRQDSPRPSGTPLINAGGARGAVLIFSAFVVDSAYQEIVAQDDKFGDWFVFAGSTAGRHIGRPIQLLFLQKISPILHQFLFPLCILHIAFLNIIALLQQKRKTHKTSFSFYNYFL